MNRLKIEGFHCDYMVDGYTLSVYLSRPASRAWGAYQAEGVDSEFHNNNRYNMRRAMRKASRALAEKLDQGIFRIDVYAASKTENSVWQVDQIDMIPESDRAG